MAFVVVIEGKVKISVLLILLGIDWLAAV